MPLSDLFAQHDADDAAVLAQLEAARADAQQAHNDLTVAASQRDVLLEQVNALTAQVATLTAELAATETHTLFGADAEGTTLAGQTAKVTKWGKGIVVRQFFTGFTQVAPRSPDVARVHASWKPTSVAAITDAAVKAACVNLLAGDVVEVWHEADSKVSKGTLPSFTEAVARKNAFYAVVKRVRPDLVVANTLTGWAADPKNTTTRGNIDQWGQVKADLLGLDCDAIHGWPYPNYEDEPNTALAFLAKFPTYSGWCVPEFGTSRNTTNDPAGSVRAAWMTKYADLFTTDAAEYVCAYEYTNGTVNPTNPLTTAAEVDAWSTLI